MKYKLKVSICGYLYLLTPIIMSLIATFIINREYWCTVFALVIFIIYSLTIYLYIVSSYLKLNIDTLDIFIFGLTFTTIKITDVKCVIVTDNGIGMTALSREKIKIVLKSDKGKGYLFSIKNKDNFVNALECIKINILYNDNSSK